LAVFTVSANAQVPLQRAAGRARVSEWSRTILIGRMYCACLRTGHQMYVTTQRAGRRDHLGDLFRALQRFCQRGSLSWHVENYVCRACPDVFFGLLACTFMKDVRHCLLPNVPQSATLSSALRRKKFHLEGYQMALSCVFAR
jgi:hypothetical protein